MIYVAETQRAAVIACKSKLVCVWQPDGGFVGKGKSWVRSYCADGWCVSQYIQESGIEDLEKGGARVRRVEELRERRIPEWAIGSQDREPPGINKLKCRCEFQLEIRR